MDLANINLPELIERFGNEDACHDYLAEMRWPDGVRCPRCESEKISILKKYHKYECSDCEYQFSVRVNTVFHDSKLPLWKWFLAIYLICQSKKGISSNQLKRMLGVSYKTAWYLTHRIRSAMRDDFGGLLTGIVEVDETWIGGKKSGHGRGYTGNKTIVVGAVQRGGGVRLSVLEDRSREELHGFIREHIDSDTEAIFTDEWEAYKGIADKDMLHKTVCHRANEWVVGDVHTNTVEGVWSLLKRSVVGTYHKLSVKHLPAYLEEIAFRFNNRDNPYMFRDTIKALAHSDRLEYRELVA